MIENSLNPVSSESPEFYNALVLAALHARSAYPGVAWIIRRATDLVLDGYRAVEPMGPCACAEHDGPAPEDRCRHDWATVLYSEAVKGMTPAHWSADYTPEARDRRATHGDRVAQVARDFAHDRVY